MKQWKYVVIVCASLAIVLLMWHLGYIEFIRHNGVPGAVKDGQVVLVKNGDVYGMFILRKQMMEPEGAHYDWFYRSDGKGSFGIKDKGRFQQGLGVCGSSSNFPGYAIRFGPFTVNWSGHEDGSGWLYYGRFSDEKVQAGDIKICVTKEKDPSQIDAADPKWQYKGSRDDKSE